MQTSPENLPEQWPGPPLERKSAEDIARLLKVLADPTRLQMLSVVVGSSVGEVTVGELVEALGLRQPTITHHVGILVDDGLLLREQRGRQVWLSIAPHRVASVLDVLR
ncbi:MAG: ArsR/SmtB family transcription factor [Leucobacter sp.]